MDNYIRPEIPEDIQLRILKTARLLVFGSLPANKKHILILGIMLENAQLLAEVNQHRLARGYTPLPVINPEVKG